MNKLINLLVGFFILISFDQCKNENSGNKEIHPKFTVKGSDSSSLRDPLIIPTPAGFYKPEGLQPLNVMEMFKLGAGNPDFVKGLHLKDKDGNPVPNSIMDDPEKPMFVQMYANDSGRVVEAVAFELTEDMKNQIMKVRMAAKKN